LKTSSILSFSHFVCSSFLPCTNFFYHSPTFLSPGSICLQADYLPATFPTGWPCFRIFFFFCTFSPYAVKTVVLQAKRLFSCPRWMPSQPFFWVSVWPSLTCDFRHFPPFVVEREFSPQRYSSRYSHCFFFAPGTSVSLGRLSSVFSVPPFPPSLCYPISFP